METNSTKKKSPILNENGISGLKKLKQSMPLLDNLYDDDIVEIEVGQQDNCSKPKAKAASYLMRFQKDQKGSASNNHH